MFDPGFHISEGYRTSIYHEMPDHFLQWTIGALPVGCDLPYLQQGHVALPKIVVSREFLRKVNPAFRNRIPIIDPCERRWIIDRAGYNINTTEKFHERLGLPPSTPRPNNNRTSPSGLEASPSRTRGS